MVMPGQYLERMIPVRSGALHLEGLYHRGRLTPPCVVAAPHPQLGGSMDGPVVAELAWAITRAGHATLRFNYRGVGASQGAWDGGVGECEDCVGAIEQLEESARCETVALAGHGFGAWAAVQVARARPDVTHLVLVAPPNRRLDLSPLSTLSTRVLVLLAAEDPSCDPTALQALLAPLGARGRLVTLPDTEPSFLRGLRELGRAAAAFLDEP